jgi:hypothetical protein
VRTGFSFRSRSRSWIPLCCALLALAVRIPGAPGPENAAPWLDGTRALQGLRNPGESGPIHTDLIVSGPLILAQEVGWIATRVKGGDAGLSEGAWARKHEGYGRGFLRAIWLLSAIGCAWLVARALPGGWGALAGAMSAVVTVGVGGTQRLEPWALAAFFLLLAIVAQRRVLGILAWAAVVSLTPMGIVAAAAALALGRRDDRIRVLASLPLWLALDPTRLTSPLVAIPRYFGSLLTAGWPGIGDGPPGRLLVASWTPGPAVALLVLAGTPALIRAREGTLRAASLAIILLWILPALLGARRADGVGLAFPVAFLLAARAGRAWTARAVRGRLAITASLCAIVIGPVLLGDYATVRGVATRSAMTSDLAAVLRKEVGSTGLLLRDPLAPPVSDSIATFTLPTHVDHPEAFDFAWWPGWYGSFTHALITVRSMDAIQRDRAERPASMAFLVALTKNADRVCVIGDPETDRSTLVLLRIRPGPPWSPEDRLKRWESVRGGKTETRFLTDLADFLAQHQRSGPAVEILRLALHWDEGNAHVLAVLGSTLVTMGEWKEAVETLEPAVHANPSSIEMRYALAGAYLAGNVPGRAVSELKAVLSARPDFAAAHYALARAAAGAGDWGLAAAALEAYLAKEPNPTNRPAIEAALADARHRAADLEEKKRRAAVHVMEGK